MDILKLKINLNRWNSENKKPRNFRNEKIKFEVTRIKQLTNKFNYKNVRIKSKSIIKQIISRISNKRFEKQS